MRDRTWETRTWIRVLWVTLLLQSVSAFLTRVAPTIAPYLMSEVALPASAIGHLSAIGTLGSMLVLLAGAPLIRRAGSVGILQIGTAVAAIGVLLFLVPTAVATLAAVFLIGIGYGPSPAAGSEILNRYAPPEQRNLIFSIKQAGVPIVGVVAGLVLPPLVVAFGIAGMVACCVVICLLSMAVVEPTRAELDSTRETGLQIDLASVFALENLASPLRAISSSPAILRMSLAGACFAVSQGAWFAFLVTDLVVHLGYGLAAAGAMFALMQATGVIGRIALGWVADRLWGGPVVLAVSGVASALCSMALALAAKEWSTAAMATLCGVAGVAVSSWNGVQIAEVVRHSRPAEIHTTVAGSTMIIFGGYVLGPVVFAVLISMSDRYDLGYLAVALVALIGAALTFDAWRVSVQKPKPLRLQ